MAEARPTSPCSVPRGDVRVPSPAPSQPFENEYQAFGGPVPPPKSPPCLSSPGQALIMSFLMPQRIAKCHQRPRRLNSTPPALVGACPPATDSENPPPAESHFACGTVTRRIETDSRCRATTNCRHAALRCPSGAQPCHSRSARKSILVLPPVAAPFQTVARSVPRPVIIIPRVVKVVPVSATLLECRLRLSRAASAADHTGA
ncbi:hypothetical protein ACCO45_009335 [Purpureocillium lilacinum]|uniref:Uncharacterized protein n=1 Tax=Purpureocillium lilacinum TaxID=33203 RepID=A0ACC4DLR2_PURLI